MGAATLLALFILVTAALYAAVGLAGASGYLAAMALFDVPAAVMKPAALLLNVVVSSITTLRYYRAGLISFSLFWPLALSSVPAAFVGGAINLSSNIYNPIVGAILLGTAVRMFYSTYRRSTPQPRAIGRTAALLAGMLIGLLAGLTGTGGGIFAASLILSMGWAGPRETAGVTAAFILCTSLAALAGNLARVRALPPEIALWALAATVGAVIGAEYGSRRLKPQTLSYLLACLLVVAAAKMIFG